jgi:hypothetical protein
LIKETKNTINEADTFYDENHSLMALLFAKKRTVLKTLQSIRDRCSEIINKNEEIGSLIKNMKESTPLPCKYL